MEMVYGVELTGMPIREYLLMLKDNGLDTLPGTAAEILDDSVRHVLSRNKLSIGAMARGDRDRARVRHPQHLDHDVRPPRDAGALGQPDAAAARDPVAHRRLHRVRAARVSFMTTRCCSRRGWRAHGGTLAEHLKVHALARVLLAGSINHIQVSWVKLGREVSQLALLAGADDYGGTLFEENISRLAGATAGQYISTAEFQERILELGRIPAQRNTVYTQYTYPVARYAG